MAEHHPLLREGEHGMWTTERLDTESGASSQVPQSMRGPKGCLRWWTEQEYVSSGQDLCGSCVNMTAQGPRSGKGDGMSTILSTLSVPS